MLGVFPMGLEVTRREIKVFFASPGDLESERKVFREHIDVLNLGYGDGANVVFIPLGWEIILSSTGPRPQDLFNKLVDECDVFFLVYNQRWGQEASPT